MKIKVIDFGFKKMPMRAHYNDAGADVSSTINAHLSPGQTIKIPLGFGIELPDGFMAINLPRSGLSSQGIISQIPPIDSGYRGEIHAIITNTHPANSFKIHEGDRIAQLTIIPVVLADYVSDLGDERTSAGFGSTGIN